MTSWLLKFILCLAHSLCHTHKQMQHPQSLFVLVLNLVTNGRTLILKHNSMPFFVTCLFFSFCLSGMIFLSDTKNIQLPVLMTQSQGAWNPSFSYYWIKLFSETDSLSFFCKHFSNNFMKYISWQMFHFLICIFPITEGKNVSLHKPYMRLGLSNFLSLYLKSWPTVLEVVPCSWSLILQKQAWKCSQLKYWVMSV